MSNLTQELLEFYANHDSVTLTVLVSVARSYTDRSDLEYHSFKRVEVNYAYSTLRLYKDHNIPTPIRFKFNTDDFKLVKSDRGYKVFLAEGTNKVLSVNLTGIPVLPHEDI